MMRAAWNVLLAQTHCSWHSRTALDAVLCDDSGLLSASKTNLVCFLIYDAMSIAGTDAVRLGGYIPVGMTRKDSAGTVAQLVARDNQLKWFGVRDFVPVCHLIYYINSLK